MLTRQAAKIGVTTVVAGRAERGFGSFDGCAEVDVVVVERVGASRGCRTTQEDKMQQKQGGQVVGERAKHDLHHVSQIPQVKVQP